MQKDTYTKGKESIIEVQRKYTFLYISIGYLIGIILFFITGIGLENEKDLFTLLNGLHALSIFILLGLFYFKKISTTWAITTLSLLIKLEISTEIIIMAYNNTTFAISLIFANITLIGMLLIVTIVTYIRFLPFIITAITTITYLYCIYISNNSILIKLGPPLFIAFIVVSIMSKRMAKGVSAMQKENIQYKMEQETVLALLNMNKEQLLQFIKIMKEKELSLSQTDELLQLFGKEAREKIENNIKIMMRQKERDTSRLKKYTQSLTPSELEICELILADKNIPEISAITGKSISNVTSTRSHIRSKLNLKKDENLKDSLIKITRKN